MQGNKFWILTLTASIAYNKNKVHETIAKVNNFGDKTIWNYFKYITTDITKTVWNHFQDINEVYIQVWQKLFWNNFIKNSTGITKTV